MGARADDRRTTVLVVLAGVLIVIAGAGAGAGPLLDPRPADPVVPPPAPTPGCLPSSAAGLPGSCPTSVPPAPGTLRAPSSTSAATLPSWVVPVVVGLLLLLAAAAVVALLRRRPRHRGHRPGVAEALTARVSVPSPVDPRDGPDIAGAVAAARSLAAAAGEPRRRVLDAWTTLEGAVAAAGSPRGPGETTGELVHHLLGADVDPAALDELHATYLRARYAPAPVPAADPERAAVLLARVQEQLHDPTAVP